MLENYLSKAWLKKLKSEFEKPYMQKLSKFLHTSKQTIYPSLENIFTALNLTPPNKIKVVILGQDPYHNPNQAHGLAFSVQPGVKPPPSLKNIYKELEQDTDFIPPNHGNLTSWAKQGVLLLNNTLTVFANKPASHKNKGWEEFTAKVIKVINHNKKPIVFLLWGALAAKKESLIAKHHIILKAPHPSPLSAYSGFFGCRHFSLANGYLKEDINWQLP